MTPEQIKSTLEAHSLWLRGSGGARAYLEGADLEGADLEGADLEGADLEGADLEGADLRGAYLRGAYLRGADLRWADLEGANLRGANLEGAKLEGAKLEGANLRGANLRGAYLEGADLRCADLRGAYLPAFQICPAEGNFIAYKKVAGGTVLKLEVIGKRTSTLVGRKCRAESVRVLGVVGSADPGVTEFRSQYDRNFVYKIGEVLTEPKYSDDIRVECTSGIHFFITQKEAEEY